MFEQIQQAFQNSQRQLNLANTYTWYGLFSSLGVLIGARAYANQGQIRFYEVGDGGLLFLVDEESEVMQLASEKPIRVIAQLDK